LQSANFVICTLKSAVHAGSQHLKPAMSLAFLVHDLIVRAVVTLGPAGRMSWYDATLIAATVAFLSFGRVSRQSNTR